MFNTSCTCGQKVQTTIHSYLHCLISELKKHPTLRNIGETFTDTTDLKSVKFIFFGEPILYAPMTSSLGFFQLFFLALPFPIPEKEKNLT